MKKAVKKLGQSLLIALITIVVWVVVVFNTSLYDALILKRLILLAGVMLIARLWLTGWGSNISAEDGHESEYNPPTEDGIIKTETRKDTITKPKANIIKQVAMAMLHLIIEDDYCAATEAELVKYCRENYAIDISNTECVNASSFINSLNVNTPNIISTGHIEMPMMFLEAAGGRQAMYRSDYSISSLKKVLSDVANHR